MTACAPPASAPTPVGGARLPPIPEREGPVAIDVVYPGEGQMLGASDSTFIFGSVGTGQANLTINGAPVTVAPNGAFLAFLPIPPAGVYEVVATAGGQTERLSRRVELPAPEVPPEPEPVPLPAPDTLPADTAVAGGVAADSVADSLAPTAWTGTVATSREDGTAIGTAIPGSGTPYHWFFPNGTKVVVTDSVGSQYRVRLTSDLSVWVDTVDVDRFSLEVNEPAGYVASVVATPEADYIDVRLSTSERLPFRVDGQERGLTVTVYGAETRTNNLLYGREDPFLDRMAWEQVADDLYRLQVDLAAPLWGWTSFFNEDGYLVVRIRKPPPIDPGDPVRGLYIGVDAGHPPGGAIGPTRLTEAEATLEVSRRLARMLEERGARVLQTRPDTAAVGLGARPLRAASEGVHLLVSVHFDAFPDGVNPFENHGTHVFYNRAQSLDLARAVQAELLRELGLRDLGVSRRDLALARPTWMPSILTESAFMMIPQNEAALRDSRVLERIAAAHLRGIEAFLRSRAAASP